MVAGNCCEWRLRASGSQRSSGGGSVRGEVLVWGGVLSPSRRASVRPPPGESARLSLQPHSSVPFREASSSRSELARCAPWNGTPALARCPLGLAGREGSPRLELAEGGGEACPSACDAQAAGIKHLPRSSASSRRVPGSGAASEREAHTRVPRTRSSAFQGRITARHHGQRRVPARVPRGHPVPAAGRR